MARWLVNRNDTQLSANGMADLREMAKSGRLGPGDLIQPPGADEWMYALEVPELVPHLDMSGGDDDFDDLKSGSGVVVKGVLALALALIAAGGGYAMFTYGQQLPDQNRRLLDQVTFSEMVVTSSGADLHAEADANSATVRSASSGAILELLAKRGDFYKARDKMDGTEGWVAVDRVLPMYQIGGGDIMKEYDPLYNPDRYLIVANASWMQLPEQREERVTVFQFMLRNPSDYDMTDLVMVARIKDAKGHELERVEFRVEGVVPAQGMTMVGTIVDPDTKARRLVTQTTFDALATTNPEVALEYNDGVEVTMQTEEFTEASIDIIELRAIPKASQG